MKKQYRIALSFAGEKRDFVRQVAEILAERFGKECILYDKFHQAAFARSDLAFHLPKLYFEQSDLIVAILCNNYENKEWCGLEWSAIYGLLKKREVKRVMLSRFDRVDGAGLYGLGGFIDLDDITPIEAAALICERLADNERLPETESIKVEPNWPEVAPYFDWCIADHSAAQHAFAQFVTRTSKARILSIYGASGTGKSHLAQQFLRNAPKIPSLRYGLFDFKGAADMDSQLRTFANQLSVDVPKRGTGLSNQLADIYDCLKKTINPTLLIFDTFEMAGEADQWLKNNLLLPIARNPWMRVIVLGQKVIITHGQAWEDLSAMPIELRFPTPEHWFEFGQRNKPEADLDFIRKAHALGANSSSLAQFLGPSHPH
ncbi:MAG: hypothetical protein JWL59_3416 [Chthoniobacteraceae bacterium]|nr:hypothetical protein [Chthoniobacteraceae bacterium]